MAMTGCQSDSEDGWQGWQWESWGSPMAQHRESMREMREPILEWERNLFEAFVLLIDGPRYHSRDANWWFFLFLSLNFF